MCEEQISEPLWLGPSENEWNGGVTQSMLQNYFCCPERFRVRYVLGLRPADKWNKSTGFGALWHVAEEALANGDVWYDKLLQYTQKQLDKYPMQREEIEHWHNVCCVQFPEYVKHWQGHSDVTDRQPLMAEHVFDVVYDLPSGRRVRLRGKFDSVDLIPSQGGIYLQENKTKSKVDRVSLQRQMRYDLQTMLYQLALVEWVNDHCQDDPGLAEQFDSPICGVRYNVVLREVTIKHHEVKRTKDKVYKKKPTVPGTYTPAETDEHFYGRLRDDYYAADPDKYFFRLICRVSGADVMTFRRQCLDPVLENLADDYQWWAWCLKRGTDHWDSELRATVFPAHSQRHFRFPFGVFNRLLDDGHTEYDEFLESGIRSGLRRVNKLFTELEDVV